MQQNWQVKLKQGPQCNVWLSAPTREIWIDDNAIERVVYMITQDPAFRSINEACVYINFLFILSQGRHGLYARLKVFTLQTWN